MARSTRSSVLDQETYLVLEPHLGIERLALPLESEPLDPRQRWARQYSPRHSGLTRTGFAIVVSGDKRGAGLLRDCLARELFGHRLAHP